MPAVLERPADLAAAAPAAAPDGPQGRLLRGYLHKTSNSLCGIKGYASLIVSGPEGADATARWARKIIHEVERMEEIFRSVGDLTSAAGSMPLERDLAGLTAEVGRLVASRHPNLRLRLGPIAGGALLLPAADLGLVLAEILSNAAESRSPQEMPVTVAIASGETPAGRRCLVIRDDGPGLSQPLLGQARDPFVTTKEGHLGIGLARVDTLMDMYGLRWRLDGGQGTGCTVTLEAADAADER